MKLPGKRWMKHRDEDGRRGEDLNCVGDEEPARRHVCAVSGAD